MYLRIMKTRILIHSVGIVLLMLCSSCMPTSNKTKDAVETWGQIDGTPVHLYTLTNSNGAKAIISDYGATLKSLLMPDKQGKMGDVVLGYDTLESYIKQHYCFGATIGRVANRIKDAKFTLDGKEYQLTQTENGNISHSNNDFDTHLWKASFIKEKGDEGLRLTYTSPDMTDGFPGTVMAQVTYILTANNALQIQFEATTDKPTLVNMTHHSYFNLTGDYTKIYDHLIRMKATHVLAIDDEIVPTGEIKPTKGTIDDLAQETKIGENIHKMDYHGYHYCYVFDKPAHQLEPVIFVTEPKSGRTLTVSTTQPGVQFYTSNAIPEGTKGKYGKIYGRHSAFCLETEDFPNAANIPSFPSTVLRPGQKYHETVIYQFGLMQ